MARGNKRKFDGKVYSLYGQSIQKRSATAMKTTLRKQGWLSRITQEYPDMWVVWIRSKNR